MSYFINNPHIPREKLKVFGEKPVVLITTGAFMPIHDGHIEMMEVAKEELEKQGFAVCGGYICPDNSTYMIEKYGVSPLSDCERILRCEKMVFSSDWLMVDKTSVYYDHDKYFPEIIERIKSILPDGVKVAFVFGSDNQGFVASIDTFDLGVCVSRDGNEPTIKDAPKNIFFVNGEREHSALSSTKVRNGSTPTEKVNESSGDYVIRNDLEYVVFPNKTEKFFETIKKIIEERVPNGVNVVEQKAEHQFEELQKRLNGRETISLDAIFQGTHQIQITREFRLSNGQIKSNKLIARPATPRILSQIRSIPVGNYVLVEDDSATGGTTRRIKKILEKRGVNIVETILLTNMFTQKIYDVVDMRDFLIGSWEGGLTVRLPSGYPVRAPYCLPYVSLATRAKLNEELEASILIWQANIDYYDTIERHFPLHRVSYSFCDFMVEIGFDQNDSVQNVCRYHIELLKKSYVKKR